MHSMFDHLILTQRIIDLTYSIGSRGNLPATIEAVDGFVVFDVCPLPPSPNLWATV